MVINEQELSILIGKRFNLKPKDARDVIEALENIIIREVAKGNVIRLSNFGKFEQRTRAGRTLRNPKTSELMVVPETKVVKFTVSKAFKELVKRD